jgi:uncharacterized protein (TIGR03435 family)
MLLRLALVAAFFSISVAAASLFAQAANAPGTTSINGDAAIRADLAFDVVSIRPSNAGPNQWQMHVTPGGDQFSAIGMPLGATILMAYFPFRMGSRDRIVGAPGWIWDDKYDFVGKIGEADLPAWQKFAQHGFMVRNPMLQTMLQNALADRCKLAVHRVPTEIDGYALVVANHGPNRKNLIESKPDDAIPDRAIKIALGARMVPIYSRENPVLHFYQTSMAALALQMSGSTPIEDRTGLPGNYNFDLARLGSDGNPLSDWDLAPLGLKLIPVKVPTENIVIDHIERPSPN